VAEGFGVVGRALVVPRGDTFRFGVRTYQLVVITAREMNTADQHLPADRLPLLPPSPRR